MSRGGLDAQRRRRVPSSGTPVVEGETGSAGTPAPQPGVPRDAGHLLVADLGATSTTGGDGPDGRVLAHRDAPLDIAVGPDAKLARLDTLFSEVRAECLLLGRLWGLGITGPVEFDGRPICPS
jgi:hypothetical protein